MKKVRPLPLVSVTDKTPAWLILNRWRASSTDWFLALWRDPRTGIDYAISQAASIQTDRETPRYEFGRRF